MKTKLTNYSKSVWDGKDKNSIGYYGLKTLDSKSSKDTDSYASSSLRKKKYIKEQEALRMQANQKILPQVCETLQKKKTFDAKIKREQSVRFENEMKEQEEIARRDVEVLDKDSPHFNHVERRVTNPNILNQQEELRRIKSQMDEEKIQLQRKQSSKISDLEKAKGVSFRSKKSMTYKLDKDGEFGFTEKDKVPATYTLSKWEKKDLMEQTKKNQEPENPTEFYDLKFDTQEVYGWSCQANLENYLEQVKSELGDRDYNRLRELFECYAGVINPLQMGKIESYQFHLFLKDHELYTEDMDRTQANLKFFQNNNTKSINFEAF